MKWSGMTRAQRIEVVTDLVGKGMSTRSIAREVGVKSAGTIWDFIKRYKIPVQVTPAGTPWEKLSPASKAELVAPLAAERKSATQIAAEVGTTRNAIIGLSRRNGIQLRGKTGFRAIADQARERRVKKAPPAPTVPLPEIIEPLVHDRLYGIMDLHRGMCKWPVARQDEWMFCGLGTEGSYCPAHRRMAYRKENENG